MRPQLHALLLQLLLLAAAALVASASSSSASQKARQSRAFLKNLESKHLLAGNFAVHYKDDDGFVLQQAYGLAVPQLGVKLQSHHSLQIGSNTKLFTSVALWQLHQRGLLDMHATVNRYMDKADFNQTSDWCPRLRNSSQCHWPTTAQLLMMSSGLIAIDNCGYPDGAWQRAYCKDLDQIPNLIGNSPSFGTVGGPSPALYFSAWGFWDAPLQTLPGDGYMYVNGNFVLGAYLVEKLSGLSFGSYLRRHILQPAGLAGTHYDVSSGFNGVAANVVAHPAYRAVFGPLSPDFVADVNRTTSADAAALAAGTAPGALAHLAALPYAMPALAAAMSGAGALHSTPADMSVWYRTLLFRPELLNLNQSTVASILSTRNEAFNNHGMYFAQGVMVKPDASMRPYGVEAVYYEGGLDDVSSPVMLKFFGCSDACAEADAVVISGIVTLTPELQVPFNRTTCEVDDIWAPTRPDGSIPVAKLPRDLCAVMTSSTLSNPLPTYVMSNLISIWDMGVRNDTAPTGPTINPWAYLVDWLGQHPAPLESV